MKEIFRAGDKVELLPYDQVKNHLGVSRQTWEQLCSIIPMTIDFIDGDDLCTRETGFFLQTCCVCSSRRIRYRSG